MSASLLSLQSFHQIQSLIKIDQKAITPINIAYTVFENHRKSLIQHCERSELNYILSEQKFIINAKNGQFSEFLTSWSSNATFWIIFKQYDKVKIPFNALPNIVWKKKTVKALFHLFPCRKAIFCHPSHSRAWTSGSEAILKLSPPLISHMCSYYSTIGTQSKKVAWWP